MKSDIRHSATHPKLNSGKLALDNHVILLQLRQMQVTMSDKAYKAHVFNSK
jgi:hypothetical protein